MSKDNGGTVDSSHFGAATAGVCEKDVPDLVNSAKRTQFLDTFAPKYRNRVEYLKELESKYNKLMAYFIIERAALEDEFEQLYESLFSERCNIVTGIMDVIDGKTVDVQLDKRDKDTEEKGLPNFWLVAMKKNELIAVDIKEQDEEALKYLKDIRYCRLENGQGFELIFTFDPNPFFKNNILTKTYHMIHEHGDIVDRTIGIGIEWFPTKCLTDKILMMMPINGSENGKSIKKIGNYGSFFNFFHPPQILDEDNTVYEGIKEQLDLDYDIGSTFRDEIIPYAVSWYSGDAIDVNDEYNTESDENKENDDDNKEYDESNEGDNDKIVLKDDFQKKV